MCDFSLKVLMAVPTDAQATCPPGDRHAVPADASAKADLFNVDRGLRQLSWHTARWLGDVAMSCCCCASSNTPTGAAHPVLSDVRPRSREPAVRQAAQGPWIEPRHEAKGLHTSLPRGGARQFMGRCFSAPVAGGHSECGDVREIGQHVFLDSLERLA